MSTIYIAQQVARFYNEPSVIICSTSKLLPGATNFAFNALDKIGFDLDTTGKKRQTSMIEETVRSSYGARMVNIKILNMHLNENH